MKKITILTILTILILFCNYNIAYSNDIWVSASPVYPPTTLLQTSSYTLANTIPLNTITYQWIPVYVNRPVVINNYGVFCKRQQIIYQTQVEWVYIPVYSRY